MNRVTGARLGACTLSDVDCDAVCSCTSGFSGLMCEIPVAELIPSRIVRASLASHLLDLTTEQDINDESVASWSTALAAVVQRPYELSVTTNSAALQIANQTLLSAMSLKMTDFDEVSGVLRATNSLASVRRLSYDANDYSANGVTTLAAFTNNSALGTVKIISLFADLVQQSAVLGQAEESFVYDNFRLTSGLRPFALRTGNASVSVPPSMLDLLTNQSRASASLVPSAQNRQSTELASKVILVYPSAYSADTSGFVSNPLYVQLKRVSEPLPPRDFLSEVTFSFPHIAPVSAFDDRRGANFTSHCRTITPVGYVFTHVCPGSGVELVHNCSLGPGEYSSYCPRLTPTCASVALDTAAMAQVPDCTVRNYTAEMTICTCRFALNTTDSNNARLLPLNLRRRAQQQLPQRRLDVGGDFISEDGVANIVTTTVYTSSTEGTGFVAAQGLDTPEVQRVYVVVVFVGTMWAAGLLMFLVGYSRRKEEKKKTKLLPVADQTPLERVQLYVSNVIPHVFTENITFARRIGTELYRHHLVCRAFDSDSTQARQAVMFKLLSTFTFALFLVAVLYDSASPDDDNSCDSHFTEGECVHRRSWVDPTHKYCSWRQSAAGPSCIYDAQRLSGTALIYLSMMVCLLTSLSTVVNDYLFWVVTAPTVEQAMAERSGSGKHALFPIQSSPNSFRSGRHTPALTVVPEPVNPTLIPIKTKSSLFGSLFVGKRGGGKVRLIPERVTTSREQAIITNSADNARDRDRAETSFSFSLRTNKVAPDFMLQSRKATPEKEDFLRPSTPVNRVNRFNLTINVAPAQTSDRRNTVVSSEKRHQQVLRDQELLRDAVLRQRQQMRDSAPGTLEYDQQWGMQACVTGGGLDGREFYFDPLALSTVYKHVNFCDKEARRINKELWKQSDPRIGVEVLLLFMVDLLGRGTPVAKIFREKFNQEFERTELVSQAQVYIAMTVLVLANMFFVAYVIYIGFNKSSTWQYQFLWSCLAQGLVYLFVVATIECVWLNYTVPSLIREEVAVAALSVRDAADRLAETNSLQVRGLLTPHPHSPGRTKSYYLNASSFLFVSAQLANAHPQLLESLIVSCHASHLPGRMCLTWPHYQRHKRRIELREAQSQFEDNRLVAAATRGAISVSVHNAVMVCAAVSFVYQKIVLRVMAPLCLCAVALLWWYVFNILAVIIVLAVLALLLVIWLLRCHRDMYKERLRVSKIHSAPADDLRDSISDVGGWQNEEQKVEADDSDRFANSSWRSDTQDVECGAEKTLASQFVAGIFAQRARKLTEQEQCKRQAERLVARLLGRYFPPTAEEIAAVSRETATALVADVLSRCATDLAAQAMAEHTRREIVQHAGRMIGDLLSQCSENHALNASAAHAEFKSHCKEMSARFVSNIFAPYTPSGKAPYLDASDDEFSMSSDSSESSAASDFDDGVVHRTSRANTHIHSADASTDFPLQVGAEGHSGASSRRASLQPIANPPFLDPTDRQSLVFEQNAAVIQ